MGAFATAVRTLTILPFPGSDAGRRADSLYFFPAVGILLGVLVAGAVHLGHLTGWPQLGGVLGVAVSVLLTRSLHLDGLADAMDAMGTYTIERRLAVMKDPHIGTFGVVAVVVALLLKYAAMAKLAGLDAAWWVVAAYLVSRTAQTGLAVFLPYARPGGGTAQSFVDGASVRHFACAALAAVLLAQLMGGVPAVIAVGAGLGFCAVLALWMKRNFGGVTGDLLGMGSEMVEIVVLAGAAVWETVLRLHVQ
jgi:adenosylcobinamide-GDP ribazoletransferase